MIEEGRERERERGREREKLREKLNERLRKMERKRVREEEIDRYKSKYGTRERESERGGESGGEKEKKQRERERERVRVREIEGLGRKALCINMLIAFLCVMNVFVSRLLCLSVKFGFVWEYFFLSFLNACPWEEERGRVSGAININGN